jgi:hypothetical protein
VANYDVSIKIAIAGAKELDRVNKQTEKLRSSIIHVNKVAEASGKKPVRNFNNLSKSVQEARDALDEAATGTKEFNQAVKNLVQVEGKFDRQLKQRERRLKIQRLAQKEGISFSKAKILLAKQEAEAEAKLAAAKTKTAQADLRKRVGGTISSAAIGGAFPLLFGQTGAAAIGGGIGGLAGGAIGGQFGFALSIVGTAIGSAVDKNQKFNESLAVLNARFSTASGGSKLIAKDIDELAKRFRVTKEEAFGLLESFKEFDNPRLRKSLVEVFGSDSGAFQGLGGSNRQAKLAQQIFEARKEIGDQQATQLLQQNLINGAEVIELALIRAKIKARQRDQIEQAKQVSLFRQIGAGFQLKTTADVIDERIKKLNKKFAETEDQTVKDTIEGLKILREQLGLVNEAQGQFGQSGVLAFSAINDKVKDLQDEMKKLASPISLAIGLSDTMANSFESSFKGIIKGTMTVADAFRNMLNRIADHFLDTAARMLANQFQQGILGLFGNLFSGFGGGLASSAQLGAQATAMTGIPSGAALPAGSFNITGALANGGTAQRGKSYLVGERGAEIFTPGVTGTVSPNSAMGGTNIVVNVDASGSNVEGDEDEGRALGIALSAAIETELIKQKRPGGLLA